MKRLQMLHPLPQPERFSWRLVVLRVEAVFNMKKPIQPHTGSTHQTVIEISTARTAQSIRIGFTDQRLTAYGGMSFWSAFLLRRAGERFWVHIAGTAGIPIVVEASTHLEAGSWV